MNVIGKFKAKSRVAALVKSDALRVYIYLALRVCALKAEKCPSFHIGFVKSEPCAVPAVSAVIIGYLCVAVVVTAVLTVNAVPGVRNGNRLKDALIGVLGKAVLERALVKNPITYHIFLLKQKALGKMPNAQSVLLIILR